MKKFFSLIILILLAATLYAEEKSYESPMSLYKDNFFLAGDDEAQVKAQVSAKYNIFWPSSTGFYLGYTQTSKWICYDKRDTFQTAYQPEVFYSFESGKNIFNNASIPFVDYIQVSPINHISNGTEGTDHRGMNIYYGQIQMSAGDVVNLGFNVKGFNYYSKSKRNIDIEDYKGHYEADVFIKLRSKNVFLLDKEELHFKFGGYEKSPDALDAEKSTRKGWYAVEARFRILTSYVQPRFFIQYFKGYDEILIDYNKKTESFRAGIVF